MFILKGETLEVLFESKSVRLKSWFTYTTYLFIYTEITQIATLYYYTNYVFIM